MEFSNYDHLKTWEGCKLEAYRDIAGVLTIGYGSTGPHVKPGMRITQEEADRLLKSDLIRFEEAVRTSVKVPLNQNQYDALVSLAYNIGVAAFNRSTVVKRLNNYDYTGAADAILMWNKVGKKVVRGLVNRREAEKALFLKPVAEVDEPADLFEHAVKSLLDEYTRRLIGLMRSQ